MATLQDFYPWVRLDCPGVPDPAMDDAIRKGAQEFCRLTGAIEADDVVVTQAAVSDYSPSLPSDSEVISVVYVRDSHVSALTPISQEAMEALPAAVGTPRRFALVGELPVVLRLYPTPVEVESFAAKFTVAPTHRARVLDDRLLQWYQDGVTAYAKYYLMSQPAKPWTNVEQAAFEFRRFDNRVGDARIRRAQWRAGIPNSVVMTPFA